MKRWLCALCVTCALGILGACEGTETGNPDPSHEHSDAGSIPIFDSGGPHHFDGGIQPPRDAGATADAAAAQDAGQSMDAGQDEDAGQDDQNTGR
jgi:hypothetical protein